MANPSAVKLSRDRDEPLDPDVAKALVLAEVARLVAAGHATLIPSEAGAPALRFASGEIFRLGEETVARVA